jgi:hypothetical protein
MICLLHALSSYFRDTTLAGRSMPKFNLIL